MIIRRRTYKNPPKVSEKYGYYMVNSHGNTTDTFNIVYLDYNGNYFNPVYKQYGGDLKTGEFPENLVDKSRVDSDGDFIITQESYTDGITIVCLNGRVVYQSTDGGVTWSSMFTLPYQYSGSGRMMPDHIVYFDSNYIYVLFETSNSATSTNYSTYNLRLYAYNRSSGSIIDKLIVSYQGKYWSTLMGPGTRLSPDGFFCTNIVYRRPDGDSYMEDIVNNNNGTDFILVNIPGLISNSNNYSYFSVNNLYNQRDSNYNFAYGYGNYIAKWNWDSSTYGCFLCNIGCVYWNSSAQSITKRSVIKIPITLNSGIVQQPTVSTLINEQENGYLSNRMFIAEAAQKNVSNETLFVDYDSTVKVMNINTWTVKQTLPTMDQLCQEMYGTSWNFNTFGINITPDGKYYVLFSTTGAKGFLIFINRYNYAVMTGTPFINTGNTRNSGYVQYMMPKKVV